MPVVAFPWALKVLREAIRHAQWALPPWGLLEQTWPRCSRP